jgi:hypothetical protein
LHKIPSAWVAEKFRKNAKHALLWPTPCQYRYVHIDFLKIDENFAGTQNIPCSGPHLVNIRGVIQINPESAFCSKLIKDTKKPTYFILFFYKFALNSNKLFLSL